MGEPIHPTRPSIWHAKAFQQSAGVRYVEHELHGGAATLLDGFAGWRLGQ
jgi:hypothetical protein